MPVQLSQGQYLQTKSVGFFGEDFHTMVTLSPSEMFVVKVLCVL